jgi:hypothetical protein
MFDKEVRCADNSRRVSSLSEHEIKSMLRTYFILVECILLRYVQGPAKRPPVFQTAVTNK